MKQSTLSRRSFLKASAAFAGWSLLPSNVWANPPSKRFTTAHIGIGGMGGIDLKIIASHPAVQVVGLADVNKAQFGTDLVKSFTSAKHFVDYREMLATLGDKIDGVVISTPDHTHFPAAKLAMQLGKPIYCQKPLTHRIDEAIEFQSLAREKNTILQMGVQLHASTGYRMAADFLQQGLIGKVQHVYLWTDKNWGYDGPPYPGVDPVPENLDWNLWLGTAPVRPYLNGKYTPGQWRKILDYGCGTLGDMGVHLFDTPCRALGLRYPTSVKATCREPNNFSHPTRSNIEFEYPGTPFTAPTLHMTWYDGLDSPSVTPSKNPDLLLEEGRSLPKQGAMFVGENGKRMLLQHPGGPEPLPRSLLADFKKPNLPKIDHYHQWVDAAMGTGSCSANLDYAVPLTISNLLGVVSMGFPGQSLAWNSETMKFSNNDAANGLLTANYRKDY